MALLKIQHLRLEQFELPSCDRLGPRSPKTPMTPGSPFELNQSHFCFRKGPARSVIYQPEGHPRQAVIDGEIWPPIFKPRNVRSAKSMQFDERDVVISTYPKCGTTWLQHICSQLIKGENYQAMEGNELCMQSPMIERMGAAYVSTVAFPRVLKTHFSHMNVPKSDTAKYIFCVRNPKDCLTSYYHHNRNFKIYNYSSGDFETFFDLFLSGQLAFGDYFDHLLSWLPHINDENVLFLKYEDMVKDLQGAVIKIGQFLGGQAQEMVDDAEKLERIVKNSTIDAMKKDQQRWFPEKQLRKSEFIRKGGSRDWKNYLTKEQSDRMDALYRTRFADTVAEHWWRREMSWEEIPENLPFMFSQMEITDEDMESVSRRGSFCSMNNEAIKLQDPSLLISKHDARRRSYGSIMSAGYGSVWSLSNASNA